MEGYPGNVKNLIRLVKHWKKKMVRPSTPDRRIPNSYLMELITIDLWKTKKRYDGTFDTLKAFHGVMEALKNYRSLSVTWTTKFYSTSQIPDEIRSQRYDHFWFTKRSVTSTSDKNLFPLFHRNVQYLEKYNIIYREIIEYTQGVSKNS